jgi:hypothetical protein
MVITVMLQRSVVISTRIFLIDRMVPISKPNMMFCGQLGMIHATGQLPDLVPWTLNPTVINAIECSIITLPKLIALIAANAIGRVNGKTNLKATSIGNPDERTNTLGRFEAHTRIKRKTGGSNFVFAPKNDATSMED